MGLLFGRGKSTEPARGAARGDNGADAGRTDHAADLKVRTRRRLVGAAALLLAAVIILPMVLGDVQRPVADNVSIEIPSEKTPFKPRLSMPPPSEQAKAAAPASESPAKPTTPNEPAKPILEKEHKGAASAAASTATATKSTPPAAPPAGDGSFVLQAAALASDAAARDLVAKLKKSGFAPYTEKVDTSSGPRIRVRVGPFPTREEAEQARAKLKAMSINATLIGSAR